MDAPLMSKKASARTAGLQIHEFDSQQVYFHKS